MISVGGLSAGGSGKTPAAAWLAMALAGRGCRPVLLSRGYRRSGRGIELVQAWAPGAAERFGDEPVWLARRTGLPVVVGLNRWRAGLWALHRLAPDVLVLDDGFQHWRLTRDFDLVTLDASRDPNGIRLWPLGGWREELEALSRAHSVLLTRCNEAGEERLASWKRKISGVLGASVEQRTFEADLVPRDLEPVPGGGPGTWSGRKVALASATASADSFARTAARLGLVAVLHLALRDHTRLGPRCLRRLAGQALARGAEAIVVTEKDAVKLQAPPDLAVPVLTLAVDLVPRRPEALLLQVESCLRLWSGGV